MLRWIVLLKRRLIVSERLLIGNIGLRVSLEKRLLLTSGVSLRLGAIGASGIVTACQSGDSEPEPMLVPIVVLVKQ